VHEAGAPADAGLVGLDLARPLAERGRLHREAETMEHEPRGLLHDPERPVNFVAAEQRAVRADRA
jgi:hypothetical protein